MLSYVEATNFTILMKYMKEYTLTLAIISISLIALLTLAVIAAKCVGTICMLVAGVFSSTAFIQLHAVEFIKSSITGETLADVRAVGINTPCIAVTVMSLETTFLLTLINICHTFR
jgi:hypothetical protein